MIREGDRMISKVHPCFKHASTQARGELMLPSRNMILLSLKKLLEVVRERRRTPLRT